MTKINFKTESSEEKKPAVPAQEYIEAIGKLERGIESIAATALRHEKENEELLAALLSAHQAIDWLMALAIDLSKGDPDNLFLPGKSPVWPNVIRVSETLQRYGLLPKPGKKKQ